MLDDRVVVVVEGVRMVGTVWAVERQSLNGRNEMQAEEAPVSVWTLVVQGVVKVFLVLLQVVRLWLSRSLQIDRQSP